MSTAEFGHFESLISYDTSLESLWNTFSPHFNTKVESVDTARKIYSNAWEITRHIGQEEKIKVAWLNLLRQGSFTLSLKDRDSCTYNFNKIIELVEAGKMEFETELVKVDQEKDDLLAIAKAISSIWLESVGQTMEIGFFQQILNSKDSLCLVAKDNESLIACSYGTHLNVEGIELFHLNFLGRKIEYPSLNLIENLQKQLSVLQEYYPGLQYLTLCVAEDNTQMINIYEKEGFKKCTFIEKSHMGFPLFFYCKKIDSTLDNPLPSFYEKFQSAMKLKREEQKKIFLEKTLR